MTDSIAPATDELMAAVPWTERRMVLVYRRHHKGRVFVRMRTFNRHRTLDYWYPSPRYFVVPVECAGPLSEAIRAASKGRPYGEIPEWYADFAKQYAARTWLHQSSAEPPE